MRPTRYSLKNEREELDYVDADRQPTSTLRTARGIGALQQDDVISALHLERMIEL
jgi:hypothetical protein